MRPLLGLSAGLDGRSLDRLRATLGSDAAYQGILRDFLTSSAVLGDELRMGLTGGPPKALLRPAHTLKSMARLLGANDLAEACRKIEFLAHATNPRIPKPLLEEAVGRLASARVAVETLLE